MRGLVHSGGTPKDFLRLDAVKDFIRQAEHLMGREEVDENHLRDAAFLCEQTKGQIRRMFTIRTLSDEAKEYAKRLVTRADRILAVLSKDLTNGTNP